MVLSRLDDVMKSRFIFDRMAAFFCIKFLVWAIAPICNPLPLYDGLSGRGHPILALA